MAYHLAQVEAAAQVPVPEASDEDDAFILEYKPSKIKGQSKGRELDPKKFSKDERKGFKKAEAENWASISSTKLSGWSYQTRPRTCRRTASCPFPAGSSTP